MKLFCNHCQVEIKNAHRTWCIECSDTLLGYPERLMLKNLSFWGKIKYLFL